MNKPSGRLGRNYRIMLCDDSGAGMSRFNPPVTPEKLAQKSFGDIEGTPVDAYVATVGPCAGYTLSYPTKVKGMEFLVDRYKSGALLGEARFWNLAENLKQLWDLGCDPFEVQLNEARRLGIDYWLQLRMNDWHHVDAQGNIFRLIGSKFYEEHPEYWIGKEGVKGWPESLQDSMAWFQDFKHPEIREVRLRVAEEACERYDVDGFEYDFMRCPGFFAFGQELENAPLITQLIRDTRTMLDDIGRKRGRQLGLSVRVPNTIEGTQRLGLDVKTWVAEDLIDIVVPSTFFAADMEENISEWVELTRNGPVRINPAIEEGFSAGYTYGYPGVPYYQVKYPVMLPLTSSMINAVASRHWRNGANGLYVFNWKGTPFTYNYDNRATFDDIGNPLRLRYKNKRYVVMRRNRSFPNCLPTKRQIPVELGDQPVVITLDVADDLPDSESRLRRVRLYILFTELTIADRVEVKLNGKVIECINDLEPGGEAPTYKTFWQIYDLRDNLPRQGINKITMRVVGKNNRVRTEIPLVATDVELEIDYNFPNGPWREPPEFTRETHERSDCR